MKLEKHPNQLLRDGIKGGKALIPELEANVFRSVTIALYGELTGFSNGSY